MKKESYYRGFYDETTCEEDLIACTSRYVFSSQFLTSGKTLDLACGTGYGTRYLRTALSREVIGGDLDINALRYGQSQINSSYFICLSAYILPFGDACLDSIVSIETIEHLWKAEDFLHEIARTLKSEGIFIVSTPNRHVSSFNGKPLHPSHVKEFRIREFNDLLSQYFSYVDLYMLFPQTPMRFNIRRIEHYIFRVFTREATINRIVTATKNKILGLLSQRFRPTKLSGVQDINQFVSTSLEETARVRDIATVKENSFLYSTIIAVCRQPRR